jgi:hypothetical protein
LYSSIPIFPSVYSSINSMTSLLYFSSISSHFHSSASTYLFPHSNFLVVSLFSFTWYLGINTLYISPKNNNFVHPFLYWFKSSSYLTRLFEVFQLILHILISWTSDLQTLQILSSSYFTSHKIISSCIGQVLSFCCVFVSLGFISNVLTIFSISCDIRVFCAISHLLVFYLAFICFLFALLVLHMRTLSLTCYHFSSILFVVQTHCMPQIINVGLVSLISSPWSCFTQPTSCCSAPSMNQ